MLVFFSNCVNTIRLMPNLLLDEKNPEDVETAMQPDHIYDADRYACMSRPMRPQKKDPEKGRLAKHKERMAKVSKQSRMRIT